MVYARELDLNCLGIGFHHLERRLPPENMIRTVQPVIRFFGRSEGFENVGPKGSHSGRAR